MIKLHRLNKKEFILNSDLIETLEATPDTVITLTTGKKLMVLNTIDEIMANIMHFKQLCLDRPSFKSSEKALVS